MRTALTCVYALVAAAACSSKPSIPGTATAIAADRRGTAMVVSRGGAVSLEYLPAEGDRVTIALGQDPVAALAMDDDAIYWADAARVRKVARGATAIADLQGPDPAVRDLTLDPLNVYWIHEQAIERVAKGGGGVEVAWTPPTAPARLATTSAGVYVGVFAPRDGHDASEIWKLGEKAATTPTDGVIVAMAGDRGHIAWTSQVAPGKFQTFRLDGTAATPIPNAPGRVAAIAGDTIVSVGDATYATGMTGAAVRLADAGPVAVVGREAVVAVNAGDQVQLTRVTLP